MTMLIRGGILHTMTAQGTMMGDVLIEDGRIAAIGPELRLPEDAHPCTLSAKGLHVTPGLIDVYIRGGAEPVAMLQRQALAAGVTSALVWPEGESACTLLTGGAASPSAIWSLKAEAYTDQQLAGRLTHLAAQGYRPACEVHDAADCQRVMRVSAQAGVRMILVGLDGCEGLETALAAADCDIVIGAAHGRRTTPWSLAARLAAQGRAVVLTADHADQLNRLTACAAMCLQEGMQPDQALQAITAAPAQLLGLRDAGRIAVDFRADLMLCDGDPLLPSTSPVMTICGGQICH